MFSLEYQNVSKDVDKTEWVCANCQSEIYGVSFYIGDNTVQATLLNDVDNAFCSTDCILEFLSVDCE